MEINRDYYLNKLINAKNNGLIKIVTGIRRCGKSYLLFNLFYKYLLNCGVNRTHIIEVVLDDRSNKDLRDPDNMLKFVKEKIVDDEQYYILIDEVQLMAEFEDVLNSFLHIKNADVYVTGSNSKFLSSDIITEFRGRGYEIKVYPLSFSEFVSFYQGNLSEAWKQYYTYGGLPLVTQLNSNEEKMNYLSNQMENVYINDVVERNNIKNDADLRALIEILSSSIGSFSNPTKLANTFMSTINSKISNKTIGEYLKYLEDAFIIEKAKKYDIKGKKYIESPSKYYFTDIGLRNAFVNYRQLQEEGHIMENIIYNELRKRGYNVDVGMIESRVSKEYKQLEVDFIANKGDNKYYIQSTLSMNDENVLRREQRPLLKINDSFKKIIIVKDDIMRNRNEEGIITMSIFDFLTDINSLDY